MEDDTTTISVADASGDEERSYRFHMKDEWKVHLERYGFVVIANALDKDGVEKAKELLWTDIEKQNPGTDRTKSSTWKRVPFKNYTGIIAELAQSAGAWHVRGAPKVREAFAKIWGTNELLVSMDCVIAWRPWWLQDEWVKPQTENMHLDQNPFTKPGLETVQGMVPLYPVTDDVGGLAVVPFSHTKDAQEKIRTSYPHFKDRGDWCTFPRDSDCTRGSVLVRAEPGDLILWDSRVVHGGKVGPGRKTKTEDETLARLSCTVCMTARSRASEKVLKLRKVAFSKGQAMNHTPHEAGTSTGTVFTKPIRGYVPPKLSKTQMELL